jgi:hypothetical protein
MATDTATTAEAPKAKKARKSFTRTVKPIFAIIKYKDEAGNEVKLNRDNLDIKFERDASALVTILTGDGMGNATVVKVELPAAAPKAAAPAA